jgi:hypothetical protein
VANGGTTPQPGCTQNRRLSKRERRRRRGSSCLPTPSGVPACGRLRQRHRTAKLENGWSEASAASSVNAFWLPEPPQAF